MALRDVDEVVYYNTEAELLELLQELRPHVRILGSDYRNKEFTGCDLTIPVYYHQRNHDWSTTRFKNEIAEQSRRQQATQPSNARSNPPVC